MYKYICSTCQREYKKINPVSKRLNDTPCECGGKAKFQIPTETTSEVMVTKDTYRGKQTRAGIEKQLTKRMRDHHDKYELAEKIDKHGLDTAERHGWTKKKKD